MRIVRILSATIAILAAVFTSTSATAEWKGIDCVSPGSVAEASVCEQRSAAAIARDLNSETLLGIAISAASTLALIITVYFSAKATRAATKAAEAAGMAVSHAQESSVRELRPYMGASDRFSMRSLNEERSRATSRWQRVVWTNQGKSPALKVLAGTNFWIGDGPLPSDFSFPDSSGDRSVGAVGPGCSFNSDAPCMSFDDLQAVIDGKKNLHVWSWVEYECLFSTKRFRSEYHARISFWGARDPSSLDLDATWHLQQTFNGVDETCFGFVANHTGREAT